MVTTKEPGAFLVNAYRCRCGHEWVPMKFLQEEPPKMCPKCKSVNWNKPFKERAT